AAKKAAAKKAAAKKAAAKKAAAKKAAAKKAAAKKAAAKKAAAKKAAAKKAAAKKAAAKKAAAKKAAAKKAAADKAAADKAAADQAAADKAAADQAAADKAAADKAAADKAAADKAAADKAAAATVDSSSSSETTNPTVDTPFADKAVHTIYTGTNTYLYTTKELTTIATTPLQGDTSVIAYPDGITTALTGKNAGDPAIPVTYKGQNLYFKGTFEGLTSNGLYPDGYYYALTDTDFYGVVKPTDPSVKLDAPFLNGSTWFYFFDGGSTIYSYQNNVWTGDTFLNAAADKAAADKAAADKAAADKAAADNAVGGVDNLNDPNYLSPLEKPQLKIQMDNFATIYAVDKDIATSEGIDFTAYDAAYQAYLAYMTPLIADMTTHSPIVRSTFNSMVTAVQAEQKRFNAATQAQYNQEINQAKTDIANGQTKYEALHAAAEAMKSSVAGVEDAADRAISNAGFATDAADSAFS
ncbi:histone H1-like repetitive region-containing protein, partial [Levilactobacillus brevis]